MLSFPREPPLLDFRFVLQSLLRLLALRVAPRCFFHPLDEAGWPNNAWAAYRSSIHQRRNVHVDSIFELLGLRVLARSLIVSALLGPVAAIIDITPAAAAVLAVIQE